MNISDAYTRFFLKSEEGKHFMDSLEDFIADAHENAEKTPENARDFTQQARGIRTVLSHIRVATTKPKKGGTTKQS